MKVVSLIEATAVNAVAKGAIEFLRTARSMAAADGNPLIDGSFITFDRHGGDSHHENEFLAATRAAGIDVDVIPERKRFDLKVLPELRRIVAARQPDLIITHSVKSHFLLWRSGLGKTYPWIAFHHGYTATDRKMRIYNRLDRWSLPKADRILTVCDAFARELAAITRIPVEEILVQHNAVRAKPPAAADAVHELRERFGISAMQRVVLSIGRLSKEKAHADLIAAFNQLRQSAEFDCKLVIVGEGPERGRLEASARTAEHGRIVFAGAVNDVQPFYALADVFVLPSHSEGSPNVLLEAMAAGVPVVATNVGGVPEIVTDGESALVVPARDTGRLSSAVARVLGDKELSTKLTRNAAQLIAARHLPEIYVRNLIDIYSGVTKVRSDKEIRSS